MNKKRKYILITFFILIVSILLALVITKSLSNPEVYTSIKNEDSIFSIITYLILVFLQILIPIIPGEPIELLAGYLFGKTMGTIICILAESLSSVAIVLIVKKYGRKILNIIFEDKKIKKLEHLTKRKAFIIFSMLYILPGTPKDLMCYLVGISDFDLISSLLVVTIGRIPSIVTSTISAGLIKERHYLAAILIYVITILVCFIDIYIYNRIIKKNK